jgi:site-specific DNA-methyltransferase (adenine-specific)
MSWRLAEGDCLELMEDLPDKSIDMILCDLPYGTTACKWDTVIPFEPLWTQYKRLIRDDGTVALTASQPFTSALVMSNPAMFKHEWIWIKNRGSNFANTIREPMKEHESVLVFANKKWTYNKQMQERTGGGLSRVGYDFNTVTETENYQKFEYASQSKGKELRVPSSWQKFNTEVGFHPTQKPVALFEYLIRTYTNEGEVVLDNCAGSGTTGVAAEQCGRNSIMMEMDAKYCEVIRGRMRKLQGALPL